MKSRREDSEQPNSAVDATADKGRQRDAALLLNEERFRSLVEATSDWIWEIDAQGVYTYASPKVRDLLGYEPEEVVGKTPFDFMPPDEAERVRSEFSTYWEERRPLVGLLNVNLHRDGHQVTLETSAVPVFDEQRVFLGYRGIDRDVTDRMATKEALRDSERRFRELFENAVMGLYRTTPDGRILMANPAILRMTGFSSLEEAAKYNLEEGVDSIPPRSHFKTLVEIHGLVTGLESTWTRADGTQLQVSESARLISDENGKPLYYDGTIEDISDRKRAEEALRTRERFLAGLSEVSQLLLSTHDVDQVLPDLLRILGKAAGVSRTYLFRNHQSADGRLMCSLQAEWAASGLEVRTSDDPALQDLPYVANGLARWVEVLGSGGYIAGALEDLPAAEKNRLHTFGIKSLLLIPLFVGRRWFGYIGFDDCDQARKWQPVEIDLLMIAATEISSAIDNAGLLEELRRHAIDLEDRVAERTSALRAVNRELEAFSYSVSHDLRAPLRSIDGFSQALIEDHAEQFDETGRDYLQRVRAASERMGLLIEDLLRLSRITSRELVRETVDLSSIAEDVIGDLRERSPGREVEVVIEPGIEARADPNLLRIALENLLENAWKFTSKRERALIEFGDTRSEGERAFFVRDNGEGFDMEYAGKLFGAFQRLHSAEEYEGTGIGLATVRRIIHRHGGRVWAEAAVDAGATFCFTLP